MKVIAAIFIIMMWLAVAIPNLMHQIEIVQEYWK